jgi:hypothetical protein
MASRWKAIVDKRRALQTPIGFGNGGVVQFLDRGTLTGHAEDAPAAG